MSRLTNFARGVLVNPITDSSEHARVDFPPPGVMPRELSGMGRLVLMDDARRPTVIEVVTFHRVDVVDDTVAVFRRLQRGQDGTAPAEWPAGSVCGMDIPATWLEILGEAPTAGDTPIYGDDHRFSHGAIAFDDLVGELFREGYVTLNAQDTPPTVPDDQVVVYLNSDGDELRARFDNATESAIAGAS